MEVATFGFMLIGAIALIGFITRRMFKSGAKDKIKEMPDNIKEKVEDAYENTVDKTKENVEKVKDRLN